MHNGYFFILQYIKNLEDQLLADNYPIGKELVKNGSVVQNLVEKLYIASRIQRRLYEEYDVAQAVLPEQKYGLEWMNSDAKLQNEGNRYE